MTTVVQAFSTNDYQNVGSYQNVYCSAVGSGNSLVLILRVPTAQLPLTSTPETWNGTTAVSMGAAITSSTDTPGLTRYVYKLDNITNGANRVRWKTSATGQCASDLFELGTSGQTLALGVDQRTEDSTESVSFTNPVANSVAIVTLDIAGDPTVTPTAPYLKATHGNYAVDTIYNADIGATGSKTAAWTLSFPTSMWKWALTFSTGAPGPTVSTITIGSVTEGGAASVTVALSGATTATTAIPCSLAGSGADAATGADLTLSLNGVTCTNGVTCDGTNFSVPSGVSGWSFSVQTTADALDEANETATLTIGGISQTLTITDDDASPALLIPGPVTVDSGDSVVASYTLGAVSGRVTYARLVLTDGTAVGGVNYTNTFPAATISDGVTISAGVLTIPAGVGSFTITIPTAA